MVCKRSRTSGRIITRNDAHVFLDHIATLSHACKRPPWLAGYSAVSTREPGATVCLKSIETWLFCAVQPMLMSKLYALRTNMLQNKETSLCVTGKSIRSVISLVSAVQLNCADLALHHCCANKQKVTSEPLHSSSLLLKVLQNFRPSSTLA